MARTKKQYPRVYPACTIRLIYGLRICRCGLNIKKTCIKCRVSRIDPFKQTFGPRQGKRLSCVDIFGSKDMLWKYNYY